MVGAPAGGERARLLVVQRGAVHVAWLAIGRAGEARDGGVVHDPVGDGDGLTGRGQELPPLLEWEIRNDSVESGTPTFIGVGIRFDSALVLLRQRSKDFNID